MAVIALDALQTVMDAATTILGRVEGKEERDRIREAPARLYEHFASVAVFDKAEQYARDNGVHLWSKRDAARPAACQLVVVANAHERMKSFLRSLRPAAS